MTKLPEFKEEIKQKKTWYREYGEALLVAAILALIIRTFVVQAFKIPSGSMEDTLLIGDHLLVCKFIYGTEIPFTDKVVLPLTDPQRGDVIVFEFPGDLEKPWLERRDFIKRIVGTPGDTVEVRNKRVYVNGEVYDLPQEVHKESSLILPGTRVSPEDRRDFMPKLVVPPGQYFVMGDNRDRSYDSRFWGFVDRDLIKGKAFIKYWSWDGEEHWPRFNRIGRLID
ncbi:signal peptidase I [Desulfuromonas acetoxidans]|uniref:signal peptidase I n=1 Tax=Desulfuromonas acetoxidans TaxID=891 RepID=UPI002930A585|nr:signal peptidase I [Desulfuromonas acetoxidans]